MKLSENAAYVDAMTCLFKGRHDEARTKLESCSESTDDTLWKAFFQRAIAESFCQERRLSDATAALDKAVEIDPSPLSLVKKAEFVCTYLNDPFEANALFAAALHKSERYSDSTFDRAKFHRQTLDQMRELGIDGGEPEDE